VLKTLANTADRRAIERRLALVRPDLARRWGKMSAHQMVCHLADSFRGVMGEKAVAVKPGTFGRGLLKWMALYSGLPWPHGVRTMPEMDQLIGGTQPAEIETDREALRMLLGRFTSEPRDFVWRKHPIFLVMNEAEWMRWGYLHMDHHFRQFGV
jgi:hypothetical protein